MSKSIAVAYSMKKKKKASGGTVESGDVTMNLSKGGDVDSNPDKVRTRINSRGVHDTYGGEKGMKVGSDVLGGKGKSLAGELVRGKKHVEAAKGLHKQHLEELKEMPNPKLPKAHGGEVSEGDPAWACSECGSHSLTFMGHQDSSHEMDMISSALHKRRMAHGGRTCAPGDVGGSPRYSHGGQVANDLGEGAAADELPNEFDDLVLRDDEEMEGYTEKNSGDDIGGPSKSDVVSKAMLKRKKK